MTFYKPRVQSISGNVLVTDSECWLWYRIPTTGWDFRCVQSRTNDIMDIARALGRLAGHRVCIRVTHVPQSVAQWAREHDIDATDPLPGWPDHLIDMQTGIAGALPPVKMVLLGVRCLPGANATWMPFMPGARHDKVQKLCAPQMETVEEALTDLPLCGSAQLSWVIRRSWGVGFPAPDDTFDGMWTSDDVSSLVPDRVFWDAVPFSKHVAVHGPDSNGDMETRFASVLGMGRMSSLEIPEADSPWLQSLDALPWGAEVVMHADILHPRMSKSNIRGKIARISAQDSHYEEHNETPPQQLLDQKERALAIENEIDRGEVPARVVCWPRIIVTGENVKDLESKVKQVTSLWGGQAEVHRVIDQAAALRSAVPGEPMHSGSFPRRMSVTSLAASGPWASAVWGDAEGIALGVTAGTSGVAAFHAPWAATENADSGLCVIAGTNGSGKSVLMGLLAHDGALSGATVDILDPSGRLQSLAQAEHLRGHVHVVDLLDSYDGALSPFGIIPDPQQRDTRSEDYDRAVDQAEKDRIDLATATIKQLLPHTMAANSLTENALLQAVEKVKPHSSSSLMDVVDALEHFSSEDVELKVHAYRMSSILRSMSQMPYGRLIFRPLSEVSSNSPRMTIYSLRGLMLPDDKATSQELDKPSTRIAQCVLSNAAWMVTKKMFFGNPNARKMIVMDEARVLRKSLTGRELMSATAVDSRKHNAVVLVGDQTPSALVDLGLSNVSSTAFIGRLESASELTAAVELLRATAAPDETIEAIKKLKGKDTDSYRRFVARDRQNQIEEICVDISYRTDLLATLNTTARPDKKESSAENSASPRVLRVPDEVPA